MYSLVKENTKKHKVGICWWQDKILAQFKLKLWNISKLWCSCLDRKADHVWEILDNTDCHYSLQLHRATFIYKTFIMLHEYSARIFIIVKQSQKLAAGHGIAIFYKVMLCWNKITCLCRDNISLIKEEKFGWMLECHNWTIKKQIANNQTTPTTVLLTTY
jgi:hypothetical protein